MTVAKVKVYERPEIHTEDPNDYHSGDFNPIYIGDVLGDRYKIFRKLGHGADTTVWLADDSEANRRVAVKVRSVNAAAPILQDLQHPHLESVLGQFTLHGVNGQSLCTILEPLGRSLAGVTDDIYDARYDWYETPEEDQKYLPHSWPIKVSREICRQILLGLEQLHIRNVAHRDIHPGNILFALTYDINSRPQADIQQAGILPEVNTTSETKSDRFDDISASNHGPAIEYVRRCDGNKLGPEEIQYVVQKADLHDEIVFDDVPPFRVVLIDLGFALPFDECKPITHGLQEYRPPETILPLPITYKADIYSAGLVFYELVTTHCLANATRDRDNIMYLRYLVDKLGPLPERFRKDFPVETAEMNEDMDEQSFEFGSLRFAARRDGPETITDDELETFADLMDKMLQWEPEDRPTVTELLKHPFFANSSSPELRTQSVDPPTGLAGRGPPHLGNTVGLWPVGDEKVLALTQDFERIEEVHIEAGMSHGDEFEFRDFLYFGDRLLKLQDRLRDAQHEQDKLKTWRYALAGIALTAFFGLISAITGIMQVHAAWRQPVSLT